MDGQDVTGTSVNPPEDGRWLDRITWGFVVVGLILRVGLYLLDFPLWWDEAFVAVNLLRRDFAGLLRPLDYGQVCPLLFLWAELATVRLLGFSEWTLRLVPLLAALASVLVFRMMAIRLLDRRAALVAVAVFAVAVHPIRHAADLKPYSLDLLMALILQALALRWWDHPARLGRMLALVGFGPIALASSHPAAFVAAGVGVAIAWPAWATGRPRVRLGLIAYFLAIGLAEAGLYAVLTRSQESSAAGAMRVMWANSFPPFDSAWGLIRWLAVVHTGDLMAYPCGGERGASLPALISCLVGGWALVRSRGWVSLIILLSPLGFGMVAAGLRLYPYGGPAPHGSAARIMQYAAPALCLLVGLGLSTGLDWIRSRTGSDRLLRLACFALLIVGIVPLIAAYRQPYRAYHAEASRRFARSFWPEVCRGAEVADLRWDFDAVPWDSVHLGVAVSLANEAIDSPSRRAGGPNWEAISEARPLRCVLGVSTDSDQPGIKTWLGTMDGRYRLVGHRVIPAETAEPGRPSRPERCEVFEFVPRK